MNMKIAVSPKNDTAGTVTSPLVFAEGRYTDLRLQHASPNYNEFTQSHKLPRKMLQNNFKLFLQLKVLHCLVVPLLQCREVLEYNLYLCVLMEHFTQIFRSCYGLHTYSISPPHWSPSIPRESNRPELCRDTTAFWGCGRAQCKTEAKHTWTAQPRMICCLLFLSSGSAALHFSLAVAARATQHTDTVSKTNPRCWRELWETCWVPLTVLPHCWRKWQAFKMGWVAPGGVPCRGGRGTA